MDRRAETLQACATQLMSTKPNKRQRIASELIGIGHRPSVVASQLNVSRETISRQQHLFDFTELSSKAHLDLLASLLADRLKLINRCHDVLDEVFNCQETPIASKSSLAVRYLALNGSSNHIYRVLKSDHGHLASSDKENNRSIQWIYEIVLQLSNLKANNSHLSDAEYRKRAEEIVYMPQP